MKWSIECKKFVQDDVTLEWKIVPMTIDFLKINNLQPDTWEMEDGNEVPVFRMEYGINRGSVWDEMVSYILTDFKIFKR